MRQAIALILTLSFLLILTTIATYIFKIYEKESQIDNSYIYQNSLNILSIEKILQKIKIDSNSSKNFKIIFTTLHIPIQNKILNIKISPLFNKIDINKLYIKKTNNYIYDYISNILDFYKVSYKDEFLTLLINTLSNKNLEEIQNSIKDYKHGRFTKRKFNFLLNYFSKFDKKITIIPWNQYIYFGNTKGYIDCDLLDNNVKNFLNLPPEEIDCSNISQFLSKEAIKKLDIIPFNKNRSYPIQIELNNLNIIYDLTKKRVIDIENYPIY